MRNAMVGLALGAAFVVAVGCGETRPPISETDDAGSVATTSPVTGTPRSDEPSGETETADVVDAGGCTCKYRVGVIAEWPCGITICTSLTGAAYTCVAKDQVVTNLGCDPTPDEMDAAVRR